MNEDERLEQYFWHVIWNYGCGDIKALLDAQLEKAGPLLACVVNGIDTIGGMMLGFAEGSKKRSTTFMSRHLGVTSEVADLLYALVRCGLAHEGVPKLAIRFFVSPGRYNPGCFLFRDGNVIWLNVTELAFSYLDAIAKIQTNIHANLKHVPMANPKDISTYQAALSLVKRDINEFGDWQSYREKHGSGRPFCADDLGHRYFEVEEPDSGANIVASQDGHVNP